MARVAKIGSKAGKVKTRRASQTKSRKTAKPKRLVAPEGKPRKRRSLSDLEAQLRLRTTELNDAQEQQAATAEILKIINTSQGNLAPVFDIILEKAHHLCDVTSGSLQLLEREYTRAVAVRGMTEPFENYLRQGYRVTNSVRQHVDPYRVIQHIDLLDILAQAPDEPALRAAVDLGGIRTFLTVPLVKDGTVLGRIVAARKKVQPFTDQQIALLKSFAAQAAIAIENARLFNETKEALERQTATADILKVIASSPSDVQPVFDAIAERSKRLVDALSTTVFRLEDGVMHLRAFTPTNPEADAKLTAMFPTPLSNFSWSEAIGNGEIYRVVDTELEIEGLRELARLRGFRSMLFVPLLRDRKPIGVIAVTRVEPGPFVEHHVQLLQTFADQAVIAIENVRLFEEVQAKTRDLTESLQQQTATAEVLKVISRSAFDLDVVLNSLTKSAVELCNSTYGAISLYRDGVLVFMAQTGCTPEFAELLWSHPAQLDRKSVTGRTGLLRTVVQIPDVMQDEDYDYHGGEIVGNYRSISGVPLLRNGELEGVFTLMRREPGNFTPRQIELVQTFADQAVIAIENVRLFDEVQARTRDLTEALTYQTGSSNILRVIASSPTDVAPVLKAIVESACELCDANDAVVHLRDGDGLRHHAHHGPIPVGFEIGPINRTWTAGRAFLDRMPVHVHDVLSADGDQFPEGQRVARLLGIRTILSVPLLRDNESIGTILLRRTEMHPFSDKQIALLRTFADQAVIAIGNVRLFEEVQARTKELAASLDDLRAAQDRLVQTEKLASLGQLTAGIAHEIKNPLNFVNNFSALSVELIDELNEALGPAALDHKTRQEADELTKMLKDNLEKVVQHGKRADSIVKNMLLHSREGAGEQRPADINALLDESLNLAYHGARAEKPGFNITLQRDFDANAGEIYLFPQEITRAFLNLISNGFYAASKRKAENGDPDFEPVLSAATKNLGNHVEIRIRDNGTGIPAEVKEKIFNPFFTTKPAGEGTGLGLSMSHDIIVKQHGGGIEVETEPGQFTEFTIILPRTTNIASNRKN